MRRTYGSVKNQDRSASPVGTKHIVATDFNPLILKS
jgi:hypothetical protein